MAEYREDGWPLCPRCKEDELWTPGMPSSDELVDHFKCEFRCYRCGWHGYLPTQSGEWVFLI